MPVEPAGLWELRPEQMATRGGRRPLDAARHNTAASRPAVTDKERPPAAGTPAAGAGSSANGDLSRLPSAAASRAGNGTWRRWRSGRPHG